MSNDTAETRRLTRVPSTGPLMSTVSPAPPQPPLQPSTKVNIRKKIQQIHQWIRQTSKLEPRKGIQLPPYDSEAAALRARNEALKVECEAAVALAHQKIDAAINPRRHGAEKLSINGVRPPPNAKSAHQPISPWTTPAKMEHQRTSKFVKAERTVPHGSMQLPRKIRFGGLVREAEFSNRGWGDESWIPLKGAGPVICKRQRKNH